MPLLYLGIVMGASGPATRPLLPLPEHITHLQQALHPSLRLLGRSNPAYPLVARQGRDVIPLC